MPGPSLAGKSGHRPDGSDSRDYPDKTMKIEEVDFFRFRPENKSGECGASKTPGRASANLSGEYIHLGSLSDPTTD